MGQNRLIRDAALAGATALAEAMADSMSPDELEQFRRYAYKVISATIEGYDRQKHDETPRLGPSRN
jgi:putative N-acetylmannosamine-6-phosphate epimerase